MSCEFQTHTSPLLPLPHLQQLERLAEVDERFTVRHVLSQPPPGWTGGSGRLDVGELQRLVPAGGGGEGLKIFVCGRPSFTQAAVRMLASLGCEGECVHAFL